MERYIGIDVHARSCTVAAMGASGKRLGVDVVETRGEALIESVKKFQGHRYVCIEEGTQSEWIHELLAPHVEDLVVIVPPENRGNKSDQRDAWGLADALRTGRALTRVYKAPRAFAGLRDAVRGYQMLSKDVTRVKNRLTTVYRSRGLADTGAEIYRPEAREPWLAQLPASSRTLAELLGEELDALVPLKQQAAQAMSDEAAAHSAVRLLRTVPGLGEIRAAQLVAVVVTPYRFRTSRQFWSYSGLGVVTRSSADWERQQGKWVRVEVAKTRGLNRNRNPMLKSIFKAAATTIITRMATHPLNLDYQRLTAAGTKPNLAKLTIARRLAAICLAIWKKQEDYDPDKHARQTNART
jgi:transposase